MIKIAKITPPKITAYITGDVDFLEPGKRESDRKLGLYDSTEYTTQWSGTMWSSTSLALWERKRDVYFWKKKVIEMDTNAIGHRVKNAQS